MNTHLPENTLRGPVHEKTAFNLWLSSKSSETNQNAPTPLTTIELAEAEYFCLQRLEDGIPISLGELARIHSLYPQGLLNGKPKDPETLASVLCYLERLPLYLFFKQINTISISNDTAAIMAVPHVAYTQAHESKRKHTPSRSRWFIKHTHEDGSIDIVLEVRDNDPSDPTDAFEIFSWLGSFEQIRLTTIELIKKGVSIDPIKKSVKKIFEKHQRSEIEMLKRKLLQPQKPDLKLRMENRVLQLQERLKNSVILSEQIFNEWVERDTDIQLVRRYRGEYQLDKKNSNDTPAKLAVNLVKEKLAELNLPEPTDILFGNDFSLRLFMSIGLVSQEEFELCKIELHDKLEEIMPTISLLHDPNLREDAIRFFLVQQISMYQGDCEKLKQLRLRLFDINSLQKLGIIRLVQTTQSPLADPIDILVPKQIDQSILNSLPQSLRKLLQKIYDNNQTIVSVPYTLGHLTVQTIDAFSKAFPSISGIGFYGKVGNASDGDPNKSSVGDLVLPQKVCNQFGENSLEVVNSLNGDVTATGYPTRVSTMMTTLALTLQEPQEMEELMKSLDDPNHIITLDVELNHLMTWYHSLDASQQEKFILYLIYYISDKTILPQYYDESKHAADKISSSLGIRGVIPLFIGLLAVLNRLAQKSHK